MDKLEIPSTFNNPGIILDPENEIYEFHGHSLPEDVKEVYEPVIAWIDEKFPIIDKKIEFEFKIDYFNTASAKIIQEIFYRFQKMNNDGADISVNWYYDYDDTDMREAGKDFADLFTIPFKMIPND
ncbi:MAG: DUF1987 domain-containing protein [Chlorobi bacterium]|nr:DUF1987 domain-containing protein [Chlorobiota bacterium]